MIWTTPIIKSINFEALPLMLLISTPIRIIEGYGIYLTITKTFERTMSMRDLGYIYGVFFMASITEVVFIDALVLAAS